MLDINQILTYLPKIGAGMAAFGSGMAGDYGAMARFAQLGASMGAAAPRQWVYKKKLTDYYTRVAAPWIEEYQQADDFDTQRDKYARELTERLLNYRRIHTDAPELDVGTAREITEAFTKPYVAPTGETYNVAFPVRQNRVIFTNSKRPGDQFSWTIGEPLPPEYADDLRKALIKDPYASHRFLTQLEQAVPSDPKQKEIVEGWIQTVRSANAAKAEALDIAVKDDGGIEIRDESGRSVFKGGLSASEIAGFKKNPAATRIAMERARQSAEQAPPGSPEKKAYATMAMALKQLLPGEGRLTAAEREELAYREAKKLRPETTRTEEHLRYTGRLPRRPAGELTEAQAYDALARSVRDDPEKIGLIMQMWQKRRSEVPDEPRSMTLKHVMDDWRRMTSPRGTPWGEAGYPDWVGDLVTQSWEQIAKKPEYRSSDPVFRDRLKDDYFRTHVMLNLPPEVDVRQARRQFDALTKQMDIKIDEPTAMEKIAKAAQRAGGIAVGSVNSPLAFFWGTLTGLHEAGGERWQDQVRKALSYGLASAYRSTFVPGDWGTLYGDYFRVVTGQTIADTLPPELKWAAPALEFTANVVSDPLIWHGLATSLVREIAKGTLAETLARGGFRTTDKNMLSASRLFGAFPEQVKKDLLELSRSKNRAALARTLQKIVEQKQSYEKWWNSQSATVENLTRQFKARLTYAPEQVPGPEGQITLPPPALPGPTPPVPRLQPTAPTIPPVPRLQPTTPTVAPSIPPVTPPFAPPTPPPATGPQGRLFTPLLPEPVPPVPKPLPEVPTLTPPPRPGGVVLKETKSPPSMQPVVKVYPKNAYLHSTAGAIAGVEEDDQGHLKYNVAKGVMGALLLGGAATTVHSLGGKAKAAAVFEKFPNWKRVHEMVAVPPPKPPLKTRFLGLLGWFNTNILDDLAVLKNVSKPLYEAATKYNSHRDVSRMKFDELVDIFRPVRDHSVEVNDYIMAHRARTRGILGIENPKGVTEEEAENAIREIESHWHAQGGDIETLRRVNEQFQQWTRKNILDEAVESGIIDQETYRKIIESNDYYAAFDILHYMPEDPAAVPRLSSSKYFSKNNQKIIMKMTGTEKLLGRLPLESTVYKFLRAQQLFAQNRVARILVEDKNAQPLLRRVAMSKRQFLAMKKAGLDPVMRGRWDPKEFGSIGVFIDGRLRRYLVPKYVADTMKQLTPRQAPRWVRAVTSVFRATATSMYLPFSISNAVRDALMAFTTSPVYKTKDLFTGQFARDYFTGFREAFKHEFGPGSKKVDEYLKHGMGFGYSAIGKKAPSAAKLFKPTSLGKAYTVLTSPLDFINKVTSTIELTPRVGIAERAKKLGLSLDDAALLARTGTIDFNTSGVLTRTFNQFVPFTSPRIQAAKLVAQAMKRDPKGTTAKIVAATLVPGLTAYAWNRLYYSDLYDDIPGYIKDNYFVIVTGSKTVKRLGGGTEVAPHYFVIPKGDVGQAAVNPLEYALNTLWKKDRAKVAPFLVQLLSDLSPIGFAREGRFSATRIAGGITPPFVKAPMENIFNIQLYTGREIVPYWQKRTKPPELQYNALTPKTYVWLGKQLHVSPARLQNFAANILAGYGREGMDPMSMIRGFTGRLIKTRGGAKRDRFWVMVRDMEQGYFYTRAFAQEAVKKHDRELANKLLDAWNSGLDKRIEEIGKLGFLDRGGLRSAYTFSSRKRRFILRGPGRRGMMTPEERKLYRR